MGLECLQLRLPHTKLNHVCVGQTTSSRNDERLSALLAVPSSWMVGPSNLKGHHLPGRHVFWESAGFLSVPILYLEPSFFSAHSRVYHGLSPTLTAIYCAEL